MVAVPAVVMVPAERGRREIVRRRGPSARRRVRRGREAATARCNADGGRVGGGSAVRNCARTPGGGDGAGDGGGGELEAMG